MVLRRSKEMVLVGYFLSRGTTKNEERGDLYPPEYLKTNKWKEAYLMFYGSLGNGRTWSQFRNSLKNIRDSYDSHLNVGRVGWRIPYSKNRKGMREPANLSKMERNILKAWENVSDDKLWGAIKPFVNSRLNDTSDENLYEIIEDLESQKGYDEFISQTEGGLKVFKSRRAERSKKLRQDALNIHGYVCMVCGFDFNKKYGQWGNRYAIIHHMCPLIPGRKRETNPRTDLTVVCANCHSMIHKKPKITLTIDELKNKINRES